jgi:hypothetical protein
MAPQVRRFALALAVIVTGATGLTSVPSGASVRDVTPLAAPLTRLVGSGSSVVFSPKRLDPQLFPADSCSVQPPPHQFNVVNETSVNQVVTEVGTKPIKLAAGKKVGLCLFTQPGTYTLGLKSDPKASLTLVVGG